MSSVITHDNFFTSSMSDLRVAKEFFQQHLPPDLLQEIALEDIELCKDKFHTPNLKGQITDMLYSVPLKHHTQCAYIAALVEHQSVPRKIYPCACYAIRLLSCTAIGYDTRLYLWFTPWSTIMAKGAALSR